MSFTAFISAYTSPLFSSSSSFTPSTSPIHHRRHPQPASRFRMTATSTPNAHPTTKTALPSPMTFIGGGGNMGSAIIRGLLSLPTPPTIRASSPSLSSLSSLPLPSTQKYTANDVACTDSRVVFLCVKPAVAPSVLSQLTPVFSTSSPPMLVSVVAGLSTSEMEQYLNVSPAPPVIRTMPNVASAVNAGVTGICAGSTAEEEHLKIAMNVMSAVGEAVQVPEKLFAPLSAVSGAGVAYLFMVAEALADAATSHGIKREEARKLAAGTVAGAGQMLLGGEHAAVLRNSVESPGGITIEATKSLEKGGLRGVLIDAVDKAVEKARKMGDD